MKAVPARPLAALVLGSTALLFCALAVGGAQADMMLTQISQTDAHQIRGQSVPASTDTVTTWISGDNARMDMGAKGSILYLGDQQMVYIIDHQKRTYSELPLDAEGSFGDLMPEDMSAEEAAQMEQMMSSMMGSIKLTVTPTDQTKQIRDWNARRYDVEMTMPMGSLQSVTWASDEIPVDPHILAALSSAASAWLPGANERLEEMEKIEGYPVYSKSTTTMMGTPVVRTEELVAVAEKPAPQGTFSPPTGYEKTDLMPGR
ncbi:MAG: hypothetical protein GF330_12145 [Candidatus Eisenbacteria bacterium]|nr:hypothetical protein [Candidatus Eisenbacteria bacterium]